MTSARIQTTERLSIRIMRWALIVDLIIVPIALLKVFVGPANVPIARAATIESGPVGPATEALMEKLDKGSPAATSTPAVRAIVRRPPLSISGKLIAFDHDNFQVYEYTGSEAAQADAALLARAYAASPRSLAWKKEMHVYADGTLVVFYRGNRASLLDSLGRTMGSPL